MTNLLLDTNSFIWWVDDFKRLSKQAYNSIRDSQSGIYVSAVSGIEIAIKKSLGKLNFNYDVELAIREENFIELPIYNRHAHLLSNLPQLHGDPFDRILIAQALADGLTIVTSDEDILKYNVPVIAT